MPTDIDIVAIVNSIYDYLEKDVDDRQIDSDGPMTDLLALCYEEGSLNRDDIFNALVRRDAILTKSLLHIGHQLINSSRHELAEVKKKLKTTTEQLQVERENFRRFVPLSFTRNGQRFNG